MALAIKPLYERGHHCKVCGQITVHDYLGPQLNLEGEIVFHYWNCRGCGASISLDSPEEFGLHCFRRETRRMRQRRSARIRG